MIIPTILSTELFVDVTPTELSIALLEDKRLVELKKEQSNIKFAVGDIYLGKVSKVMPGLNAAFVNIGYEKDAFLHYLDLGPQFRTLNKFLNISKTTKKGGVDLHKIKSEPDIDKKGSISDVLKVGQEVLVQVAKEPISTKGPRLTSELSIAGRNIVLMPFSDKVSVSQKIKSVEERNRLRRLLESIKPQGFGVIVRTVAEGMKVAELDKELRTLFDRWEEQMSKLDTLKPKALVLGEIGRTTAILRDVLSPSFHSVYVSDSELYKEIRDYVGFIDPEKKKIVKEYNGNVPLFDQFGIEKQIKSLFGKTVSFKSGAYLIIEHTEALHVIDVNSGNRAKKAASQENTALDVNLAAADEIARQLRLRDMGGIIVVDFIDMQRAEHRQQVYDRMKEAMSLDRTKHNILPLSKFGLMQITRQRVRPEMEVDTNESCPTCYGTGKIAPAILLEDQIERSIRKAVNEQKKKLTLTVHPYIEAYLRKGFPSIFTKWKFKYSFGLRLVSSAALSFLEFNIEDLNNKKG